MKAAQKAEEVLKLQQEIDNIKSFCEKLKVECCSTGEGTHAFIKKQTTNYFIGKWKTGIVSEMVAIPDKINLDITVSCLKWIEELERRIEVLIPSNKNTNDKFYAA
tara:strand:- start:50 stop:367 length:318 start_codon:yes stop_codon:yes gene_type:complete